MIRWAGLFFQNPNTYMIELIICIHDYVIIFLVAVIFLVFLSLIKTYVSKFFNLFFFENHQLENVWTILPFLLLLMILISSLSSLYILDTCNFCGFTIGVIGHQWYWSYQYKDFKNLIFDSYILNSSEPGNKIRLLEVDNRLFLARLIPTRFLVGSADVLHSWTVPSFGFKIDAVPGRINQFCVTPKRTGVFFGQCSEICGANHRFIPIVLESLCFKDLIKLI